MSNDEVTQIIVDGHRTGIIGLKGVLESVAAVFKGISDRKIAEELMVRLAKKNYIPERVREDYKTAFLREYKKSVGEPFEEAATRTLQIKVLGPGCPNCDRLEQEVMAVITEMRLPADLEHVRNPLEIGSYGMVAVPGLVVDGRVVSSGGMPTQDQMKAWLTEAAEKKNIR